MKSKRTVLLKFFLLFCFNFSGLCQEGHQAPLSKFKDFPAGSKYQNAELTAEERVADVIKYLNFEEALNLTGGFNRFYFPGVPRLGLRPIYMADATQGVRWQKDTVTITTSFPGAQALASTWNPSLAYKMGNSVGQECRILGVDILLGPGINMQRLSVGGRNYEYFGEDPLLTSQMAVAYIRGIQDNEVIATPKHFIGNDQEFARHITSSNIDERTLREIYLPPWKAVIQEGNTWALMTGNNLINGTPNSLNRPLVKDVLRDEFGFRGMAMTDWQNTNYYPNLQYLFLPSGVSLLMPENETFTNFLQGYLKKYPKKKEEIKALLNIKASQNLLPLFEMGVYDRELTKGNDKKVHEQNKKIAQQIAAEAITLLKNEDNLLPLGKSTRILLTGGAEPHSGSGSGFVKGYDHTSFAQGLKKIYGNSLKVTEEPTQKEIKEADVVIYRLNKPAGEGRDIPFEVGLDSTITEIASLNPNLVVIISSGNGLPMPWLKSSKAVLWANLLGQERGNAMAKILSGEINPSGKLPFTLEADFQDSQDPDFNFIGDEPYWFGNNNFYKTYWKGGEQQDIDENFKKYVKPHQVIPVPYSEGVFMGYRWYDKTEKEVLFPFGHGISYTTFGYDKISINKSSIKKFDTLEVVVTVRNTGKSEGAEVVQLYITDLESSVERPVKELKKFRKILLSPGENQQVRFSLSKEDLSFWDVNEKVWKAETGEFIISIGSSSRDIRQKISFNLIED